MLEFKNISVSIADTSILKNISHVFPDGSVTALLGPNGSGKSTLGNTLLGAPFINVTEGDILFDGKSILALAPDERARLGIFLSFQSPLPLGGVSAMDLFRASLTGKGKMFTPVELHARVHTLAQEIGLDPSFLKRSLYEGFSGGERKKMEALQAVLYAPKLAIFDEIDTGVDVDALRGIVTFLKKNLPANATLIFITHSHKLLSALAPEHVVVLKKGNIVATGDKTLADAIEKNGFEQLS